MIAALLLLIVCILLFGAAAMRNVLGVVFLLVILLGAATCGVEWARESEKNATILGTLALTFVVIILWAVLDELKRRKQ